MVSGEGLAQVLAGASSARLDADPVGVEHGAVVQSRPEAPLRIPLLVALAAAPVLVLLAQMPTNEARSSCGMIRPWNETLTAQMLVWLGVFIAYKAVRSAWKLRFEESA